jgi:hypothetical protein
VAYWPNVSEQMNAAVKRIIVDGAPVKATLDELHAAIETAARAAGAEYPPAEDGDAGGAAGISPSPGTTPEASPAATATATAAATPSPATS